MLPSRLAEAIDACGPVLLDSGQTETLGPGTAPSSGRYADQARSVG